MKNLKAEMARYGVTKSDIKKVLNCSDKTVDNKLNGVTDFTVPEALKIRNAYFKGYRIDYLFAITLDQVVNRNTITGEIT